MQPWPAAAVVGVRGSLALGGAELSISNVPPSFVRLKVYIRRILVSVPERQGYLTFMNHLLLSDAIAGAKL